MKLRILCSLVFAAVVAMYASAEPFRVGSFQRVDSLVEEIVIAKDVKRVPDFAFAGFRRLKSVSFETGSRCRKIGEGAFYRCDSLQSVSLPAGVEEIGRYAFAWCVSLRRVNLDCVGKIGDLGFAYCSSLPGVSLSSRLTSLGSNAFSCCLGLEEVVVPSSVKEVGSYAFSGCASLRRAVLPGNPSLLGELIFSGCISLEEIEEPSVVPPRFDCGSFIFDPDEKSRYYGCRLLVPTSSVSAYRSSPGWSLFVNLFPID